MHTVIETESFLRDAAKAGMTEAERTALVNFIAANPDAGDLIKGSGGFRKLRFAGKGKGKSGGYRAITFFAGADIPVFLFAVYAKNKLGNLTDAQTNELKIIAKEILKSKRR